MRRVKIILLIIVLSFSMSFAVAQGDQVEVSEVTELEYPWGLDFVGEQTAIVTEKPGHLSIVELESESSYRLEGVPDVEDHGQGGLLDVEYVEEDNQVFLTYSSSQENVEASEPSLLRRIFNFIFGSTPPENSSGLATHLGKAELNLEDQELDDFEVLHVAEPYLDSGSHFGSRVTVKDEHVYFTVGDRGDKDFDDHVSQQTDNELGTTIRLYRDGTIPNDNPFVENETVEDSIYTYGHRNAQGMTVHPETGEIWQSEHGEQDGDEINIIEETGNYGWPQTHYGCTYATGQPIGQQPHELDNIVNPVYYWECNTGGFPPAGMTFYTGEHEEWQGDLFIGNLAEQHLGHFQVNGREVQEKQPLLQDEDWRIRDVEQSPSGQLYIIADDNPGPLAKIEP